MDQTRDVESIVVKNSAPRITDGDNSISVIVQQPRDMLPGITEALYRDADLRGLPASFAFQFLDAVIRSAPCGVVASEAATQRNWLTRNDRGSSPTMDPEAYSGRAIL